MTSGFSRVSFCRFSKFAVSKSKGLSSYCYWPFCSSKLLQLFSHSQDKKMTKKKVTTTYRREFSPDRSAKRPSVVRTYDANSNYREYRRQVEHGHHRSPFLWGDWEYDTDIQYIDTCHQREARGWSIVQPQEVFSTARESYCRDRKKNAKRSTSLSDSSNSCGDSSGGVATPANNQEPRYVPEAQVRRYSARDQQVQRSDDREECNCGADVLAPKPTRFQGQPARVLSDTISKTLKKVAKRSEQADFDSRRPVSANVDDRPFTQFGTGDEEQETGAKRTYNVLSRHGVYPSALGAKQRIRSAKEFRKGYMQFPSRTDLTKDPHFDRRMDKQTSRWQSEYSKRYRQFPVSRFC